MKKVCHLALIELTALYDVLGVELKQQKAVKIKTKGKVRFGSIVVKNGLSSWVVLLVVGLKGSQINWCLIVSRVTILSVAFELFIN